MCGKNGIPVSKAIDLNQYTLLPSHVKSQVLNLFGDHTKILNKT